MQRNHRDWLQRDPTAFLTYYISVGGRCKEQRVLQLVPAMLTELKMKNICVQEKVRDVSLLFLNKTWFTTVSPPTHPLGPPVGCPPWHSGSSPPRRCGAVCAGRWSAWPGWRRHPGWSNAAARRTPARDPTSSRLRRRPPPAPWRWPAIDRCLSTECPSGPPPASGYRYLSRERQFRECKLLAGILNGNAHF